MKKFFLIGLLITLISQSSCTAQNLSKAIENSFGERLYVKFECKLYVKQATEKSVLIVCKTKGVEVDYFDKAFVIFSETGISTLSLNPDDNYEIQIPDNKKFAIIYNISKNKIHFIGTSDKANDIAVLKKSASISQAITNEDCLGYGMSYMINKWDAIKIKQSSYKNPFNVLDYSNMNNPDLAKSFADPNLVDDGGVSCKEGACTSGGAGSSSCSINGWPGTSCSVTCNTGLCACCSK